MRTKRTARVGQMPSIAAAARALGRSRWHLSQVLKGSRKSPELMRRYQRLLKKFSSSNE